MNHSLTNILLEMQAELFAKRGHAWFRILSGSMRPLIDINDRILVEKIAPSAVRPGDVILFQSDDTFITHRALKIIQLSGKTMIVQKGDTGGTATTIPGDAVVGKVRAIEKIGGTYPLQQGRLGALNIFLSLRSTWAYRINGMVLPFKNRLSGRPGFAWLRFLYRGFKWPFVIFNKTFTRVLMGS